MFLKHNLKDHQQTHDYYKYNNNVFYEISIFFDYPNPMSSIVM